MHSLTSFIVVLLPAEGKGPVPWNMRTPGRLSGLKCRLFYASAGCGLPPGPNGLWGAAEGVSYLVVGGFVVWSLGRRLRYGKSLPTGETSASLCV